MRADAVRALAGVAAEATEPARALDAVARLLALGRLREVVAVARASGNADVRAAAVDGLTDQRSLGSIARHAADQATRLRALARMTDAEELLPDAGALQRPLGQTFGVSSGRRGRAGFARSGSRFPRG